MTSSSVSYAQRSKLETRRVGAVASSALFCFDSIGEPHLHDRLTSDADALCLQVEGIDHPERQVHIDTTLLKMGPRRLAPIEKLADVFSVIKPTVEFLSGDSNLLFSPCLALLTEMILTFSPRIVNTQVQILTQVTPDQRKTFFCDRECRGNDVLGIIPKDLCFNKIDSVLFAV